MKKHHHARAGAATLALFLSAGAVAAEMDHDHASTHLFALDRLERRDGSGDPLHWKIRAWSGDGLSRLQLKSEGARNDAGTADAELELAYSRAFSPYWDAGAGVRIDFEPGPRREWLALGVHGVAPWFIDIDANLYLGSSGRSALRVEATYEVLFTQRLILEPAVELDAYGRNDAATGNGAGIATLAASLRLRYEVTRKLAPYAGIHWRKHYGNTAAYARDGGQATEEAQALIGVRAWY
jgi:copper resistance protein B